MGSNPTPSATSAGVRSGQMGYGSFRDNTRPEEVCERFQSAGLVVEVAKIILHEGDEPDTVIGLFDSDGPIRRDLAVGFCRVTLRYHRGVETHVERQDNIVATVRDLATDDVVTITADYLVGCSGGVPAVGCARCPHRVEEA